ncbi:HAD family hydrolase [Mangrovibacterium diazotrophicum]|uniref:Haloacid dehalogenase-like hydrolase n=1 Tax=Mangrovibacterium diazotrophicum TaxID=1261403 RepID=A0A419WAM3_9BACT|nr:HAD family hydrolase [Mangrovibacterium diazotrophicum]RKD92466.1 haloacid dehalogenase-like hydrolase [Mangrovibacterium diazotrophicum]
MKIRSFFWVLFFFVSCSSPSNQATVTEEVADPLSLWNNGEVKTAITGFVAAVTDSSAAEFVSASDRIAVFDNDGTLWCEKPLYIPVEIELAYIKSKYSEHPEWSKDKLFKAIANNDLAVLGEYSTGELISKLFSTQDGMMEKDYQDFVYQMLSTAKHSRFDRPFKETTFSPMVQLVHYLQENGFKVYIVTGGEISSVRTVSEEIYNIPKENVVGSSVVWEYVSNYSGTYLVRTGKINSANDKQVKPTNIELHIGRKPIFAAGNSDGDYQMMEYTLSNSKPSMAILVHHDDSIREYNYMHGTEKAIEDAAAKGWYVVSMEKDFNEIFAK